MVVELFLIPRGVSIKLEELVMDLESVMFQATKFEEIALKGLFSGLKMKCRRVLKQN